MKRTMGLLAATAAWVVVWAGGVAAAGEVQITVTPASAGSDVPVSAPLVLGDDLARLAEDQIAVEMKPASGPAVAGQIVKADDGSARLWWIVPQAKAGEAQTWTATLGKGTPAAPFTWKDTPSQHLDLLVDGKCVTRYMYASDTSTKETAFATYKVYTHVMNPAGDEPITNGPAGQYPHHRGVFIGFAVTYDGNKRGDWWHMSGGRMEHQKFLSRSAGPVLARMVALIHWNDKEGKPVVVERREQTVFRQPAGTMLLLDFRSDLTAARSDIDLGGDPEHAGMHFRPSNDVNRKATKYLFPDEAVTAANVAKQLDLAWAAERVEIKAAAYCVQHMSSPANPKGSRYSAYRDYGRFGAFAPTKVAQGKTQPYRYRLWLAGGEMPPRQDMQARWEAFANPPKVEVK